MLTRLVRIYIGGIEGASRRRGSLAWHRWHTATPVPGWSAPCRDVALGRSHASRALEPVTSANLSTSRPKVSCCFHHGCPCPGSEMSSLSRNRFSHFHLETTQASAIPLSEAEPTVAAHEPEQGPQCLRVREGVRARSGRASLSRVRATRRGRPDGLGCSWFRRVPSCVLGCYLKLYQL